MDTGVRSSFTRGGIKSRPGAAHATGKTIDFLARIQTTDIDDLGRSVLTCTAWWGSGKQAAVVTPYHREVTERDWDLRITARCLRDDLGLDPNGPAAAEVHADAHPMVRAFFERRGQSPVGQETFRCGTEVTGRPLYTLHAGDDRGATWHQESVPNLDTDYELGVVWLLGVRPEHDYDALCELDLLPATADYQALIDESAQTFAQALVEQVPELLALAQRHKGRVVQGLIADTIRVRLYCDADNEAPLVTLAYSSRPLPNGVALMPRWQTRLVLAFFGADEIEGLSVTNDIGGEPLAADESAYCSFAP
jgi:hypothetical protein